MKGATHLYGSDRLEFLLLSQAGHSPRTIAAGDERIATYGMEEFTRLRMDLSEFAAQVTATFGQYGYGKVLIDDTGILRGIDLGHQQLLSLLPQATSTPPIELDGFEVTTRVTDSKGGRDGSSKSSKTLTSNLTARVTVRLSLPEGWHVYGNTSGTAQPSALAVDYSGSIALSAARFTGAEPGSGADEWVDAIEFTLVALVPEGTPIGRYFMHGRLSFTACDEDGCLPPLELPWHAVVPAL